MKKLPYTILYLALISLGIPLFVSCTIKVGSSEPFGRLLEEERAPTWSPDSQRLTMECYLDGPTEKIAESNLHYFTEEAADICVIDVDGRNFLRITKDQGQDRYPIWSPDGTWIAYIRHEGLYVIEPDGSNRRQLIHHTNALEKIDDVSWSPTGTHLLFSGRFEISNRDIYLVDVTTGTLTNLTQENDTQDFSPRWLENGAKVVYLSANTHWYEPSPARLKIMNADGSDKQVVYDKEVFYNSFSVLTNGQIIFTTYDLAGDYLEHLYIMDTDTVEPVDLAITDRWSTFSLSPNSQYLVYQEDDTFQMMELETGEVRKLSSKISNVLGVPSWASDGQQIALTSTGSTIDLFYDAKHIYLLDLKNDTVKQLIPHN